MTGWVPTSVRMTKGEVTHAVAASWALLQAPIHSVIPGLVPWIQRATYSEGAMGRIVRSYWTYILASKPRGTLYIGVTNGLVFRIGQHREGKGSAFTRRYKVYLLVWYEEFQYVEDAIQREKSLKNWPRAWKVNLIERTNPHGSISIPRCQGRANLRSPEFAEIWAPGTRPG